MLSNGHFLPDPQKQIPASNLQKGLEQCLQDGVDTPLQAVGGFKGHEFGVEVGAGIEGGASFQAVRRGRRAVGRWLRWQPWRRLFLGAANACGMVAGGSSGRNRGCFFVTAVTIAVTIGIGIAIAVVAIHSFQEPSRLVHRSLVTLLRVPHDRVDLRQPIGIDDPAAVGIDASVHTVAHEALLVLFQQDGVDDGLVAFPTGGVVGLLLLLVVVLVRVAALFVFWLLRLRLPLPGTGTGVVPCRFGTTQDGQGRKGAGVRVGVLVFRVSWCLLVIVIATTITIAIASVGSRGRGRCESETASMRHLGSGGVFLHAGHFEGGIPDAALFLEVVLGVVWNEPDLDRIEYLVDVSLAVAVAAAAVAVDAGAVAVAAAVQVVVDPEDHVLGGKDHLAFFQDGGQQCRSLSSLWLLLLLLLVVLLLLLLLVLLLFFAVTFGWFLQFEFQSQQREVGEVAVIVLVWAIERIKVVADAVADVVNVDVVDVVFVIGEAQIDGHSTGIVLVYIHVYVYVYVYVCICDCVSSSVEESRFELLDVRDTNGAVVAVAVADAAFGSSAAGAACACACSSAAGAAFGAAAAEAAAASTAGHGRPRSGGQQGIRGNKIEIETVAMVSGPLAEFSTVLFAEITTLEVEGLVEELERVRVGVTTSTAISGGG